MDTDLILVAQNAVNGLGTQGIDTFWATGAGKMIGAFLNVFGVLVVIGALLKAFKDITTGNVGRAVKVVLGSAIFAVFLFQPELIEKVLDVAAKIWTKIIDSVASVADIGGTTPGSPPP